jgi:uncharacterized protein with von Willebrand factor type A (vWA) domain
VSDPHTVLVSFARALRDEGLNAGTDRIAAFCRAATLCPDDLYWAGRVTLLAKPADIAVYDHLYNAWFGRPVDPPEPSKRDVVAQVVELAPASRAELLRTKSFARCTPEELAEIAQLMARLALALPPRRTRRHARARHGAPDLRRTLRRSFRTGGEPVERFHRARRRRQRRLVLLVDVSGSMADYSRALVLFAYSALRALHRCEVFCFGTRLTRITRPLAGNDTDEALRRATAKVVDWEGGTRIGDSLKRFLDEYGHGGLARGAVVIVCSDGLEAGDPEQLAEQMARLSRLAYRVVWLNPLKEDPAYEPLARGMQAALPFVDVFMSGHNLANLEELRERLDGPSRHRR